jgi:hypothetical protein
LFQDLERQGLDGLKLDRDKTISAPGLGDVVAPIAATNGTGARFVIGLHGPLTPDEPTDDTLRQIKEYSASLPVILVDELVVRRNLPTATSIILRQIT